MPASLPSFSGGLKLVRIAVFIMLAQLVLTIVMTVKALGADTPDELRDAIKWTQYFLLANAAATFAMLLGMVRAIPELARFRIDIRSLVIAALGFAIATGSLLWTYRVFSTFVDVVLDPDSSADAVLASVQDLESVKYYVIIKDLAYAIGLISVLRTVERSAAINDQLSLRDEAASMGRALIVMLVADLFYQLTYGLGGAVGILGVVGSLLVGIYWIYCHVRLQRFLANAAWFMNEPHDLPLATVIRAPETAAPRGAKASAKPPARPSTRDIAPSSPPPRPSTPKVAPDVASPAPPIVITPPPPPPPPPRAASSADAEPDPDGPRFLR